MPLIPALGVPKKATRSAHLNRRGAASAFHDRGTLITYNAYSFLRFTRLKAPLFNSKHHFLRFRITHHFHLLGSQRTLQGGVRSADRTLLSRRSSKGKGCLSAPRSFSCPKFYSPTAMAILDNVVKISFGKGQGSDTGLDPLIIPLFTEFLSGTS